MKMFGFLAFASALLTASPSMAITAQFNLTGFHTAAFNLPLSPTDIDPAGHEAGLDDATIFAISSVGIVDGESLPILFHFYTGEGGGGMDIISLGQTFFRFSPAGDTVFTGSIYAPTFVLGEYDFTDFDFPEFAYHLSISADGVGAAPEPATWAMMILGLGLVGGVLRRHRKRISQEPSAQLRNDQAGFGMRRNN